MFVHHNMGAELLEETENSLRLRLRCSGPVAVEVHAIGVGSRSLDGAVGVDVRNQKKPNAPQQCGETGI